MITSPKTVCLDLTTPVPRPMAPPAASVLCLGNFDGVHCAHAALPAAAASLAARLGNGTSPLSVGVFSFFRPSGDYFSPNTGTHLTTLRDKLSLLRNAGASFACLCDFPSIRDLSPTALMELLVSTAGCRGVACGYNHRFGRGASGGVEDLAAYFGSDSVTVLPPMEMNGLPVSATRIRAALTAGDTETATRLLGRPYSLTATVIAGKQLGRALGFPTANQFFLPESLVPAHGVYAVRCHTPHGIFPAVANVGRRPTVDAHGRVNCETHILGYSHDLYGHRMQVDFLAYLRPERRFDSLDALREAIRRDAEAAEAYVRTHGWL